MMIIISDISIIMEIISFIKLFTILGKTLIWLVPPHSNPMQLPTNGKLVLSLIPLQIGAFGFLLSSSVFFLRSSSCFLSWHSKSQVFIHAVFPSTFCIRSLPAGVIGPQFSPLNVQAVGGRLFLKLLALTNGVLPSTQSDNNQIVRIFIFFIFIFSWIKDYSIVLISELRSAGSNSVLWAAISSFMSSPLWVLRSVMLSFEIVATMSVFVCSSLRVAGR